MQTQHSNGKSVYPTRIKLALISSLFGSAISALIAYRLLGELGFGASSQVDGVATVSAWLARLAIFVIIFTGYIISFWAGERLAPDMELKFVGYLFGTLRWTFFLLMCVACWRTFRLIRTGDATSLAMAAFAVIFLPLDLGFYRSYLCALLGIACLLVSVAAPRAENGSRL